MDNAREEGRAVKAGTEDVMDLLVRMEDVAVHLRRAGLDGRRDVKIGEAGGVVVAELDRKLGQVEGADVDARGSAGLHPGGRNAERSDLVGDPISRRLADAAPLERVSADEHPAVQEGSGGQNNRSRMENCPGNCTDARQYAILKEKIRREICVNA